MNICKIEKTPQKHNDCLIDYVVRIIKDDLMSTQHTKYEHIVTSIILHKDLKLRSFDNKPIL